MNKRKKTIERLTITGKTAERPKALKYCFDNNYLITYSAPMIQKACRKYDISQFKIVAEKEM